MPTKQTKTPLLSKDITVAQYDENRKPLKPATITIYEMTGHDFFRRAEAKALTLHNELLDHGIDKEIIARMSNKEMERVYDEMQKLSGLRPRFNTDDGDDDLGN